MITFLPSRHALADISNALKSRKINQSISQSMAFGKKYKGKKHIIYTQRNNPPPPNHQIQKWHCGFRGYDSRWCSNVSKLVSPSIDGPLPALRLFLLAAACSCWSSALSARARRRSASARTLAPPAPPPPPRALPAPPPPNKVLSSTSPRDWAEADEEAEMSAAENGVQMWRATSTL